MKKLLIAMILFLGFLLCIPSSAFAVGTVINKTLTVAGTEYSVDIPYSVGAFSVQSRTAADFQMTTVANTSGTNYFTVKANSTYYESLLTDSTNHTLYFQSATAGQVIEIIYWKQ